MHFASNVSLKIKFLKLHHALTNSYDGLMFAQYFKEADIKPSNEHGRARCE